MKTSALYDAFVDELSCMHYAESELVRALPKMAAAANDAKLSKDLKRHLEDIRQQIQSLEALAATCNIKLRRQKCAAVKNLIEESGKIIKNVGKGPVRDSLLISVCTKIVRYEVESYGCLFVMANKLGFRGEAEVLYKVLERKKACDENLALHTNNDIVANILSQTA